MARALTPADDLMHEVDPEPHFNESMYFNVYDPAVRCGGFFRIGNRPNEGHAETTACVFLPGGRVAFTFARAPITSNDAFDAGGMSFAVDEPMARQRVAFLGKVVLLTEPLEMADPKRAFASNPWTDCAVSLSYGAVGPAHGGEGAGNDFARGHYVQHVAARGAIRVGDQELSIDGFGLRDHSWGPRHWQSPWWYRWLTGNAGADHGFLISIIGSRDGERLIGGIVLERGEAAAIVEADVTTEWREPGTYHSTLRATVRTDHAVHAISGRVLSLIPLRHRREDMLTRISEGLTEWRWDGHTGYGLSEYLDQIVDGRPVGGQ